MSKINPTPGLGDAHASRHFKVLDLFSGAGGFSLGLELLPEFETVVANDFMKDALDTLAFNHPAVDAIYGDITSKAIKSQIVEASIRRGVNMIIGGPPCQGFSNKGKKLGLKDPRNFLFREYLDIVATLQPDVFVIENVKAMSTSSNGWFMAEILREIGKRGYVASSGILNASDFGVPQARQRTFIIASKNKFISLPVAKPNGPQVSVRDAISDLSYLESSQGQDEQKYSTLPQTPYQRKMRVGSKILFNHKATNHAEIALRKLAMIPPEGGKDSLPPEMHGNQQFKTTWGRLKWDSVSPTIDTRFDTPSNGTNSHPFLNRSITPREAARIQSFPDNYRFLGTKTNIGKQIGNAVPPLLAKAVGESILMAFRKSQFNLFQGDSHEILQTLASANFEVDHVITDPPYNISKSNNFDTMSSSKRQGVDFGEWDKNFDLVSWIAIAAKMLKPGGTFLVFNSYRNFTPIIHALESAGLDVKDVLRWVKTNPMPRNTERRYVQDTEYAIWAVKPKKAWTFNKPPLLSYLRAEFSSSTVSGHERTAHPTQKSKKLMTEIIEIHTNPGDVVLDPFMGSGTTGVAAIGTGRNFVGIELDREYFQIAERRIKGE